MEDEAGEISEEELIDMTENVQYKLLAEDCANPDGLTRSGI
jgi:hypothetical protein